jgi:hypothetical protein
MIMATTCWKAALWCTPVLSVVCLSAFAQNSSPGVAIPQGPLYDPSQLPTYTGRVRQFTLSPRGDIDGLILNDGTEVKTPPPLSTSIAYSVKPGDSVNIHGLHAAALPLIQAVALTDQANGRTIIDNSPPPRPRPQGPGPSGTPGVANRPVAPLPGLVEVRGRVRMPLPPPAAVTFAGLLQPGQTLVAEGVGLSNALGKVLEVQQVGPSRERLNFVAAEAPPRKGKR